MQENQKSVWGVRLNFTNGSTIAFQFSDESTPAKLANEINEFLQMRVQLLSIKDDKGKRAFRASDVLPKRKCTIDIVYNGELIKGSLTGVPVQPSSVFNKEGRFFEQLLTVLLAQSAKIAAKKEQALVEMV